MLSFRCCCCSLHGSAQIGLLTAWHCARVAAESALYVSAHHQRHAVRHGWGTFPALARDEDMIDSIMHTCRMRWTWPSWAAASAA